MKVQGITMMNIGMQKNVTHIKNMLKHLYLQYVHLECGAPQLKKIKFIGDTVMIPIADFNKLNAENKNNGLLKDGENE